MNELNDLTDSSEIRIEEALRIELSSVNSLTQTLHSDTLEHQKALLNTLPSIQSQNEGLTANPLLYCFAPENSTEVTLVIPEGYDNLAHLLDQLYLPQVTALFRLPSLPIPITLNLKEARPEAMELIQNRASSSEVVLKYPEVASYLSLDEQCIFLKEMLQELISVAYEESLNDLETLLNYVWQLTNQVDAIDATLERTDIFNKLTEHLRSIGFTEIGLNNSNDFIVKYAQEVVDARAQGAALPFPQSKNLIEIVIVKNLPFHNPDEKIESLYKIFPESEELLDAYFNFLTLTDYLINNELHEILLMYSSYDGKIINALNCSLFNSNLPIDGLALSDAFKEAVDRKLMYKYSAAEGLLSKEKLLAATSLNQIIAEYFSLKADGLLPENRLTSRELHLAIYHFVKAGDFSNALQLIFDNKNYFDENALAIISEQTLTDDSFAYLIQTLDDVIVPQMPEDLKIQIGDKAIDNAYLSELTDSVKTLYTALRQFNGQMYIPLEGEVAIHHCQINMLVYCKNTRFDPTKFSLTFSDCQLTSLDGDLNRLSWRNLSLEQGNFHVIKGDSLEPLTKISGLKTINLYGDGLDYSVLKYLTKHKKTLTNLSLGSCKLSDENLVHLKELNNLTQLKLKNRGLTPACLEHIRELTALTRLDLPSSVYTDISIEYLKELKDLTELDLRYSSITGDGLVHLKELEALTTLDLSDTNVTNSNLVHLKDMKALTALNLSRNRTITDEGIVQHLKDLKTLTVLSLTRTSITNQSLEHLKKLKSLSELNLAGIGTTDDGLEHLKDLKALTVLDLSNNIINDGLEHLKGLESLTTLDLSHNQISDRGLEYLKGLESLTTLDLSYNQISDRGLGYLKGMKALADLNLNYNYSISPQAITEMHELTNLKRYPLT